MRYRIVWRDGWSVEAEDWPDLLRILRNLRRTHLMLDTVDRVERA